MAGREQWCEFQQQVASWEGAILPPHENTPQRKLARAMEEVDEVTEAVVIYDGSSRTKQEVEGEAGDVIIRMIGLIISTGGSVVDILDAKIAQMHNKYPPEAISSEIKGGAEYNATMAKYKTIWNQDKLRQSARHPRGMAQ